MENKQIKKAANIPIKITKSIKRPRVYLFEKNTDLKKLTTANLLLENKIELINDKRKIKLLQDFKDSCFKIMLSNHLSGKH
jgi:hypothetical protein